MNHRKTISLAVFLTLAALLAGCAAEPAGEAASQPGQLRVLAVESFLADIAQQVAGDRLQVEALIPSGLDPHVFQPAPRDVAKVADSDVLILIGAGVESWLDETLENAGGERLLIEASAGLESRTPSEEEEVGEQDHGHQEGDPHFWLDPISVIRFVENIRDGFIQADPEGREIYTRNAGAYIEELKTLDTWIREQVAEIPVEERLLVTNHESFGYYADRYGFRIIGAVVPSASSGASPSAQELARLIDRIREFKVRAIFLETGANPRLAEQIAAETGVRVVTGLYTHSISDPGGEAPGYIEMMRANTRAIVEALRPGP